MSENGPHIYKRRCVKNLGIRSELIGIILEFGGDIQLLAQSALVEVCVILCEDQHIREIRLNIKVEVKRGLKLGQVPLTDIQLVLLQICHHMTEPAEIILKQRLLIELIQH